MGDQFRLSSQPDVSLTRKFKMTETAAAKAPKAPKKAAAKAPKTKPAHPPTSVMIVNAVTALKERNGSSLPAIKKYIAANYKADTVKLAPFIKKGLKNLLIQTKGKGASGSFKVAKVEKKEKKPAKPKAKKPAAKKTKAAGERKAKSPQKKAAKPKSPKKKAPKKAKSPVKKAKKPAAKKPAAAKKTTPKKTAAKKKKSLSHLFHFKICIVKDYYC